MSSGTNCLERVAVALQSKGPSIIRTTAIGRELRRSVASCHNNELVTLADLLTALCRRAAVGLKAPRDLHRFELAEPGLSIEARWVHLCRWDPGLKYSCAARYSPLRLRRDLAWAEPWRRPDSSLRDNLRLIRTDSLAATGFKLPRLSFGNSASARLHFADPSMFALNHSAALIAIRLERFEQHHRAISSMVRDSRDL